MYKLESILRPGKAAQEKGVQIIFHLRPKHTYQDLSFPMNSCRTGGFHGFLGDVQPWDVCRAHCGYKPGSEAEVMCRPVIL